MLKQVKTFPHNMIFKGIQINLKISLSSKRQFTVKRFTSFLAFNNQVIPSRYRVSWTCQKAAD